MALDRVSSDRIREIRQQRKKRSRIRFAVGFFALVIIILSLVFISRAPQLAINSVVVRGNYIVPTEEVKSTVENILNQYYLYFFPKKNVFLYPNRFIESSIKNTFPRFESVTVDRTDWNQIIIDVTERKNLYLYCDSIPFGTENDANCYYVDARGYIFSPAPTFTGNVYFVFLGNFGWSEGESPLGKHIATEEIFSKIVRFKEGLQQNNILTYAFRSYEDGSDAFLLSTSLDDASYKIIFSLADDIDAEYANIISALSAETLKKELIDHYDKLEYINLRFGKKVYYKFSQ